MKLFKDLVLIVLDGIGDRFIMILIGLLICFVSLISPSHARLGIYNMTKDFHETY